MSCNLSGRIDADVPQILINREPLRHMTFDVELLGDCDVILAELCKRLGDGWTDILQGAEPCPVDVSLYPSSSSNAETSIVGDSHEMPSDSANTDAKCSLVCFYTLYTLLLADFGDNCIVF